MTTSAQAHAHTETQPFQKYNAQLLHISFYIVCTCLQRCWISSLDGMRQAEKKAQKRITLEEAMVVGHIKNQGVKLPGIAMT